MGLRGLIAGLIGGLSRGLSGAYRGGLSRGLIAGAYRGGLSRGVELSLVLGYWTIPRRQGATMGPSPGLSFFYRKTRG